MAYYGGKTSLADWIVAQMPAGYGHYVEPFAGSLAVLLARPPSRMETVNDLDADLITFWRVLRDRPDELIRACALTPHSRAEHTAAYEPCADELEHARRVWVRLTQGRAGTLRRTGWRHYIDPAGSYVGMPDYLTGYINRMAAVAERLASVSLESRPALDLIARYGREPDVLLYVDPPYPLGTGRARNYAHEMCSDDDHRELAEALHACNATVVLSGYASPLYDTDLYAGWHRATARAFTGQGNQIGEGERVEVLWSNRPLGAQPSLLELLPAVTP